MCHFPFSHGLKYKQEYTTERVKLEVMRDKMVEDLEKRGINPKVIFHFHIAFNPNVLSSIVFYPSQGRF